MATRLSGLLERIRPSGTPGAAADGVPQRDREADEEIAALARILRDYQADAGRVTVEALDRADEIRTRAEQRVDEVQADLPARLAVARATNTHTTTEAQIDAIDAETAHELERLGAHASAEIPLLVDAALTCVWDLIPPNSTRGDSR